MQDFLDTLDRQLTTLAAQPDLPIAPAGEIARRRRRPVLAGAVATLLAGGGVLVMTGTSTAELPILSTPTTDATELRARVPQAAELGVDFSAAHQFATPGGPGYVLVGLKTDAVCLLIPDPDAPGDFGSSCAPSLTKVERGGLQAEFPGDLARDPKATALSAFVLPDGAKDVRLTVAGRTTAPSLQAGVLVTELATEGRVRWSVDGHPASKVLEGPFPATTRVESACADGRAVSFPMPPATTPRDKFGAALRAATKKACAK